jgi:Dienelactone hydrolase family
MLHCNGEAIVSHPSWTPARCGAVQLTNAYQVWTNMRNSFAWLTVAMSLLLAIPMSTNSIGQDQPLSTIESSGRSSELKLGASNEKALGSQANPDATLSNAWSLIARNFSPPDQFKERFGDYRSPLRFDDGREVTEAEQWVVRREEIRHYWATKTGKWPPLITDPKLEVLDTTHRENFQQSKVRFLWMPGEVTTGYLLIPDGAAPKPAVISVYYEPETAIGLGKPYRDFALQLARRGFVALSIGTTDATAKKSYALYYPSIENAEVEPLSMLGYAAANAWHVLASRPEVDSKRIGIVGHSFGGKWAMFGSCLFDKFACAAWSDPGIVFDDQRGSVNYWEPWYLGYHPQPWRTRGLVTQDNPARGAYPILRSEGHDLHELHALMAPRPFLVSGGAEDPPERWLALNHTIAVNKLLGYTDRVAMTNRREHTPDEQSNAQIYAFFEHFLGK